MKKRIITLLITVCLLASLCVNVSAAPADKVVGYLVSYNFKAGDTIYAVCEAKKIDFNANINGIAKLNNITNFNYMMPGKTLWLPSKSATTDQPYYSLLSHTIQTGETPASLCQSYGVDYNKNYNLLTALNGNTMNSFMAGQSFLLPLYIDPNGSTDPTPTPTPTAKPGEPTPTPDPKATPTAAPTPTPALPTGDTVSYYLAQYVLQYGQTISGICAELGIDFYNNSEAIKRINNIANFNNVLPGRALYFPVKSVPTTGSYYKVMSHKVAPGDTVYDLCGKYNLNFGTYENMIKGLNNRNNLASFYVGEALYMPVYVASATVVPTPTPGASSAPTATPAPGTTPTPVPSGAPSAKPSAAPAPQNIPEADTLSHLLIPYIVKAGDTGYGICNALGLSFDDISAEISRLSGGVNWNDLKVGQKLYIPSNKYPSSGPYYKIMAHKLVAGDTVYDLCIAYGLDYNSNCAFIQRINNHDLSTYYVGDTVYMPLYVGG